MQIQKKKVIALCDDQQKALEELEEYVRHIGETLQQDFEIQIFHSGEELLEAPESPAIIFLDIEMEGIDGIETGRRMKQKNPECKIIMATGNENRYKDAFRIQAFRFITKPFEKEEIDEALKAVLGTFVGTDIIELYRARNLYQIRQLDIKYAKAYNGYTEFAVQESIFRKESSLDALQKILDTRTFYRINRQYMVNMYWIQHYDNGILTIDDQTFKVSRRKRSDFEKKYVDYDIKYRRG